MRVALKLWSYRNPPVQYNEFQSLYFKACREDYTDEDAVEGESLSDRQSRMRAMYAEIQGQAHGPNYLALAFTRANAAKARRLKEAVAAGAAPARPREAAAATAATTATGLGQRTGCDAAGTLLEI